MRNVWVQWAYVVATTSTETSWGYSTKTPPLSSGGARQHVSLHHRLHPRERDCLPRVSAGPTRGGCCFYLCSHCPQHFERLVLLFIRTDWNHIGCFLLRTSIRVCSYIHICKTFHLVWQRAHKCTSYWNKTFLIIVLSTLKHGRFRDITFKNIEVIKL